MANRCFYSITNLERDGRHECKLPSGYIWQRGPADPYRLRQFKDVAERCADNFYTSHLCRSVVWPLEFVIYATEDGDECCRVMVECECDPVFSCSVIEEQEAEPSPTSESGGA